MSWGIFRKTILVNKKYPVQITTLKNLKLFWNCSCKQIAACSFISGEPERMHSLKIGTTQFIPFLAKLKPGKCPFSSTSFLTIEIACRRDVKWLFRVTIKLARKKGPDKILTYCNVNSWYTVLKRFSVLFCLDYTAAVSLK